MRKASLSSIVGVILAIGIAAVAGAGFYATYTDQISSFDDVSNDIAIKTLHATINETTLTFQAEIWNNGDENYVGKVLPSTVKIGDDIISSPEAKDATIVSKGSNVLLFSVSEQTDVLGKKLTVIFSSKDGNTSFITQAHSTVIGSGG